MTIRLRQSTASQEIPLGYFVDSTDGNTEETGLTIANTDIKLWKAGATTLANKNSGGATHISNGIYYATLDATDTDTVGPLVIFCHVSGALTVRLECEVLEEAVYDALFAASAPGYVANAPVNVSQISGDSVAADNAESFFDGTGYAGTNNVIPTVTTLTGHTPQTGDAYARLGAPAGASVSADIAAIKGETATILADTNELQTDLVNGGRVDLLIDAIKAKTDNLPASPAATGDIPTAGAVADAVWDEILSGHAVSGSTGEALSAAGGAGDPWITALPGSYTSGQAGHILGTYLDAAISTRSTYAGGDTAGTTTLLSRLSATRAGYLDNLSGGAVALASSILDAAGLRSALGLASANLDTQLGALPTANENADALLDRNVAGGSSTGRTVKQALYLLRNKWIISGGTLTVYGTDDVTSAWTASVTQTAGDPVSASDPA